MKRTQLLTTVGTLVIGGMFSCTPREQATNDMDSTTTTTVGSNRLSDTTMTSRRDTVNRRPISEVLEQHTPQWMQMQGVVGTGEGESPDGMPAVIIMTNVSASEMQSKFPSAIEGYPVIIREVGDIKPLKVY